MSRAYVYDVGGLTMGEKEILEDTTRTTGRDALKKNVQAAIALSGAIRSTLGPKGLDKLLIDDDGRTLVTNDGVTVLETAKVEHPVAKMVIGASSLQDKIAKDGTTSTVILCSEMLRNAWELVVQGIHPAVIGRGFRMAEQKVIEEIEQLSLNGNKELFKKAVMSALSGKGHDTLKEIVSEISLNAVEIISNKDEKIDRSKIKIISQTGSSIKESEVIQGLVLAKKRIASSMPKNIKNGSIMLVDGGIERRSFSSDMKLNVTTPGVLESFRTKEREMLTNQIDKLKELGIDVIACKEGIDDSVKSELAKLGIQAFRRVAKSDLDLLSKSCNATIVHDILSATKENIGMFLSSSNKTLGGLEHWVVDAVGSGATIIIRGSTVDVVGEVERCFDDSLGVVCQMYEDDRLLPGGGATYVALARLLRRYAETIPDREQLAIEAYGDALEVIVRVLSENGGMDPIGSLLSVVSKQTSENSNRFGINLYTGEVEDMVDSGIIEPLGIVRQAVIGATEAAISILRIDDVLWAKQDIAIPELPGN